MKILRLPKACGVTGDSRSGLYYKVSRGLLPKPVRIGARAVGWVDVELQAIIRARVAGRSEEDIRTLVKQLETARQSEVEQPLVEQATPA
jgi:prophage regulatory protein